jgi:hypothetical protein
MSAMRNLHAIVKERQADWRGDAADERRLALARDGSDREGSPRSAAVPDPAARRIAMLFHTLRRRDSGTVRP